MCSLHCASGETNLPFQDRLPHQGVSAIILPHVNSALHTRIVSRLFQCVFISWARYPANENRASGDSVDGKP